MWRQICYQSRTRWMQDYKKALWRGFICQISDRANVCGLMTNLHKTDQLSFIMRSPIMQRQKEETGTAVTGFERSRQVLI